MSKTTIQNVGTIRLVSNGETVTPFSVYLPTTRGVESGFCGMVTPGSATLYIDSDTSKGGDLRATYEVGIYGYDADGTRIITESFTSAPREVPIPEGIVIVTVRTLEQA